MSDLDRQLLRAHEEQDAFGLVDLYTRAADEVGEGTAAKFFLTQAYVFALESGHPRTSELRVRLRALKSEE